MSHARLFLKHGGMQVFLAALISEAHYGWQVMLDYALIKLPLYSTIYDYTNALCLIR